MKPGNEKVFSAVMFSETCRLPSLKNLLTGAAPTSIRSSSSSQTEKGAPIVRITDLNKKAGDFVSMDVFHELNESPFIGDEKIEGRGETLDKTEFEAKINQIRKPVDIGGRMSQKRTSKQLKGIAKTLLNNYYKELMDEKMVYMFAGARGQLMDSKTKVPLSGDPRFAKIMINDVLPPTYDRHFFGGDATSFETLDSADVFTIDVIKNIRMHLDESSNPLQAVQYGSDTMQADSPFHVMFLTPRQWKDMQESTTAKDYNNMLAQASNRGAGFDHPLFKGDAIMVDNILIKKYHRPVRFLTGSTVKVCTNTKAAATADKTAGTNIERAILLGAQAMGDFYGTSGNSTPFSYWEGPVDHGNGTEASISWFEGLAKIRYEHADGYVRDHGIICVDTAVKGL